MKIWLLLPAYNEEISLDPLLTKLESQFTQFDNEYQIVVVNDGSVDNTAKVLTEYQKIMNIEVINHTINRGLGETERDGFEYIALHGDKDDVVIRMDCDDTHEPQYISSLLECIAQGNDVVITSRFQDGGGQEGVVGYRAFISYCANIFMRLIFNIRNVRDYSCGYRAYSVRIIQDAVSIYGNNFIQLRGLGFTSTLEMLVKLNLLGAKIAEVPFILRYDQKKSPSKMSSLITIFGYLVMGFMYHLPFRGWRAQFKGLGNTYQTHRLSAIEQFQQKALPPETNKLLL